MMSSDWCRGRTTGFAVRSVPCPCWTLSTDAPPDGRGDRWGAEEEPRPGGAVAAGALPMRRGACAGRTVDIGGVLVTAASRGLGFFGRPSGGFAGLLPQPSLMLSSLTTTSRMTTPPPLTSVASSRQQLSPVLFPSISPFLSSPSLGRAELPLSPPAIRRPHSLPL
jgi:hypothetical protein